jgi:hypothetical protein
METTVATIWIAGGIAAPAADCGVVVDVVVGVTVALSLD